MLNNISLPIYNFLSNLYKKKKVQLIGKKLPNILTIFRILLVPCFVLLMIDPSPVYGLWATIIFILASFTDWLDGYIARAFSAQTILGTLLDPLADKILVMAALIMLSASPIEPNLPAWMVVVLLGREFLVTGLRSLAAVKGLIVPASEIAKHKTAWIFIAIVCLLIKEPYKVFNTLIDFHEAGMVFIWIGFFLSIISGVQYVYNLKKVFIEENT